MKSIKILVESDVDIIDTDTLNRVSATYNLQQFKDIAHVDIMSLPRFKSTAETRAWADNLGGSQEDIYLCPNTDVWKVLTGKSKLGGNEGIPCTLKDTRAKVFWIPDSLRVIFDPSAQNTIDFILREVMKYVKNEDKPLGYGVIRDGNYFNASILPSIEQTVLDMMIKHPMLAIDIETTCDNKAITKGALHHYSNRIVSIAFSWSEYAGIAIYNDNDKCFKTFLKHFFECYTGTTIYHNCSFDITNLVYHLYMNNLEDYKGMLKGLHTLFHTGTRESGYKYVEDTKHIAYLALNSTSDINLGLKALSHEYTGNYAQEEISNAERIDRETLLKYNLTDTCATFWVFNKYRPTIEKENLNEIYDLFMNTQKVLIETQLIGLRMDTNKLQVLKDKLTKDIKELNIKLQSNEYVQKYSKLLRDNYVKDYNATHKVPKTYEKLACTSSFKLKTTFNSGSSKMKEELLYDILGLPAIDFTKSGARSTSRETLEKLLSRTADEKTKEIIQILIDLSGDVIIMNTFIKAFDEAPIVDNLGALYGNFVLGGTVSGRLSSNSPNMQNLPSTGSPWAKPIKELFIAPKGFLFVGADQRSLEDHISALLTKDSNKLKVYTDSYDGHCLRAYSYYKEKIPEIKLAEDTDKCFRITFTDGTTKYVKEDELAQYQ